MIISSIFCFMLTPMPPICNISMDIQTALKKETALGSPQYIFECDYGLGLGGIEAWTKSICTELLLDGRKNLHIISDRGEGFL